MNELANIVNNAQVRDQVISDDRQNPIAAVVSFHRYLELTNQPVPVSDPTRETRKQRKDRAAQREREERERHNRERAYNRHQAALRRRSRIRTPPISGSLTVPGVWR